MLYEIQNEALHVTVSSRGAELWALEGADGTACLWDADPAVWPWHAPVCFPWCGALEEGWTQGGRPVPAGRHGLVRDLEHTLVERSDNRLRFRLRYDGPAWPWPFTFETVHTLEGTDLVTTCTAVNDSPEPMPVQLGFHTGLRCPFTPGRRAEDYLVRRQMEAEQEAEQVRQQAQSEGYRQGYAEGLRQAGVEGQAELQKQREQQAEELQAFLEKATAAREELLRETRGELCELSLAIAEKVIHVSLNSSSEVVARMIQVATEKLKRREWVHIYVGGCAAKEVSAITPELMTALAGLSDHIKIIPLSDDEAGTCIIEMPDEIIDASASTQLKNIRDLIHEI